MYIVFVFFQAIMRQDYTLDIQLYHKHEDIVSCAEEIAGYAGNHDNWYKPILPGDAGCQDMEFVPEQFDHFGSYWNCLNQPFVKNGNYICRQPLECSVVAV